MSNSSEVKFNVALNEEELRTLRDALKQHDRTLGRRQIEGENVLHTRKVLENISRSVGKQIAYCEREQCGKTV